MCLICPLTYCAPGTTFLADRSIIKESSFVSSIASSRSARCLSATHSQSDGAWSDNNTIERWPVDSNNMSDQPLTATQNSPPGVRPPKIKDAEPDGTPPSPKASTTDAMTTWEEELLAAAEGRITLEEDIEPEDAGAFQGPTFGRAQQGPRKRVQRTASIKYTPTEKYWLNRTYRAYRAQQAAQKEAKSKKVAYHIPADGLLTHNNMMDSFNDRFAGKYIDGLGPRPPRERHAFSLWSAKNMREDDEHMKGQLPDYWRFDRKQKPAAISLEEHTTDKWDCDEYLGVTKPDTLADIPQRSGKRKLSNTKQDMEQSKSKNPKLDPTAACKAGDARPGTNALNYLQAPRSMSRRRNSAPALGSIFDADHPCQRRHEFRYSLSKNEARVAWQDEVQKAIILAVEKAIRAVR